MIKSIKNKSHLLRVSYLLYSSLVLKKHENSFVFNYLKFYSFISFEIFKRKVLNNIYINKFVFFTKRGLNVIGYHYISSNTHKIKTKIPIHELKIIEAKNCILYCTNYHGIILEKYKVNLLSIHSIYGNNVSENFRNYPHHVYEAIISNSNEIISLQNQKYLLCHNWFNYYHFLTETVYKIFATGIKNSDFVFVFPEGIFESSFVEEIINMLEINYIKIPNKKTSIFHFEKLFFVSEKPHCEEFNYEVIFKVKSYFRSNVKIKRKNRKIFIARKVNQRRSFQNHDDVERVFIECGFEIIYAEDLTFKKQLQLFSEACYISGLHGAGLTNMIFANDGCKILEIMPRNKKDSSNGNVSIVYHSLALSLGYTYSMVFTHPSNEDFFEGAFYLNPEDIRTKILN